MLNHVLHIGLTVTDLDRSVAFYRDVLGLKYLGEMLMEGEETDRLFAEKNARARVAYLNGSEEIFAPAIELIQFTDIKVESRPSSLFTTSISEICFHVDDIEAVYQKLLAAGVTCLSAPESFDFTSAGFGRSKALYFLDPDGITLELIQEL